MGDITLTAASRNALSSLQDTTSKTARTQQRLQSGNAVNSAIDDAVKFFQAKGLSDRASNFSDLKTSIDQTVSLLQTTSVGLTAVESLYKQMKGLLQTAKTATDAKTLTDLSTQWNGLLTQANSIATDASYQGQNLVQSSDPTAWSNTDGKQVQVSPDPNEPKVGIQASILPPYSNLNQYSCGDTLGVVAAGTPIIIDQNICNQSTGTNAQMFNWPNPITDVCGGPDPIVYQDHQTGTWYANDSLASYPLSNVSILQQTYPVPTPAINCDPVTVLQATTPALAGSALPAGTYIFLLGSQGPFTYIGNVANGFPANSQAPPANTITQKTPTLDWSSAFNNFVDPSNITTAEAACDNSIAYAQSLQSYYGGKNTLLLTRMDFTSNMVNTLTTGSDKMTLADLNTEGANLVALQTREQIGIQSLSLAGQSQSAILSLLR